jgi:hypothetical protein
MPIVRRGAASVWLTEIGMAAPNFRRRIPQTGVDALAIASSAALLSARSASSSHWCASCASDLPRFPSHAAKRDSESVCRENRFPKWLARCSSLKL